MAFRPDGRQLAICSGETLEVWDLAQKKLTAEIWFPNRDHSGNQQLDWTDDEHVLLDGSTLVDVGRQIVLWKYKSAARGRMWGGVFDGMLGYLYTRSASAAPSQPSSPRTTRNWRSGHNAGGAGNRAGNGAETCLCFTRVPHTEAMKTAESLKLDELSALAPGGQVALDLQGGVSGDDLQKLSASIEDQLKKKGITVASTAPITLRAAVETGKTDTKTYHRVGGGGEQTVTTTERIFRLTFVENGKVLWEATSSTGGGPSFMRASEGETAQQALDRLQSSSPLSFFMHVTLPGRIVRYGENGCFGTSELVPASGSPR